MQPREMSCGVSAGLVEPCVTPIAALSVSTEAKCDLVLLTPGWVFPGLSLQPRAGCEWLSLQLCVLDIPQGTWTCYCTQLFLFPFPGLSDFHILFILESGLIQQEAVRQFIHILYFTIASTRKEMP